MVLYDCDTDDGSVGAPVISSVEHAVLGIHLAGGCPNSGTSMDAIRARISPLLEPCAHVPATCGNGLIDPGEECDGTDLGGNDCRSVGYPGGGTLACVDDCTFLTVDCFRECLPSKRRERVCNCDGICSPKEASSPDCSDCF